MQKKFDLNENEIRLLQSVKEKIGVRTEIAALRYIFQEFEKIRDDYTQVIANLVTEKLRNDMVRIRLASRTTEKNTAMLLDAVNTILFFHELENCIPLDTIENPVLETSEDLYKEKLAHYKQRTDHKKH